jgi:hypothetical protein
MSLLARGKRSSKSFSLARNSSGESTPESYAAEFDAFCDYEEEAASPSVRKSLTPRKSLTQRLLPNRKSVSKKQNLTLPEDAAKNVQPTAEQHAAQQVDAEAAEAARAARAKRAAEAEAAYEAATEAAEAKAGAEAEAEAEAERRESLEAFAEETAKAKRASKAWAERAAAEKAAAEAAAPPPPSSLLAGKADTGQVAELVDDGDSPGMDLTVARGRRSLKGVGPGRPGPAVRLSY